MTTLATGGVLAHRRHTLAQLARFCVVGASGYAVNLAVFAALTAAGADHRVAALGAFLVAFSSNFRLNRRWTFAARGSAVRFLLVSTATSAAALGLLELLVGAGVEPVLGQAVSIVVLTPLSFLGNRLWCFRA